MKFLCNEKILHSSIGSVDRGNNLIFVRSYVECKSVNEDIDKKKNDSMAKKLRQEVFKMLSHSELTQG
jgi:hypothetical protein